MAGATFDVRRDVSLPDTPKTARTPVGRRVQTRTRGLSRVAGAAVLACAFSLTPFRAEASSPQQGIDVSSYQGTINWASVGGAGITFAYIRAGVGNTVTDVDFKSNWQGASASNITPGAYLFFVPADDPNAQANLLLQQLKTVNFTAGDIVPAIDVEETDGQSGSTIASELQIVVNDVKNAIGTAPAIYTSPVWWNDYVGSSNFTSDPLWVADWCGSCGSPSLPANNWGGNGYKAWQYSDSGTVPGISGSVDLDQGNPGLPWYGGLRPPSMTALTPSLGPVAGGQTVTVRGLDFGIDTTATFGGSPITISNLSLTSFTFVTPPSGLAGGTHQVQATDAFGTTAALTYTYIGLANYSPVTPFRLLDTRTTGGPLGPGAIRPLQVTGVGASPLPSSATAAVVNVTEVSGSASSLLTVYPYGTSRPNASNLNFAAHTVIANLVTVTLGANAGQGWINIYNALGSVNVVVDVEGYFSLQSATHVQGLFHPITPVRVCDTRTSCEGRSAIGPGKSIVVTAATAGGIPSDGTAEAAVVNLTGVAGSASTYLSLFPTDINGHCNPTGTSTINLLPGVVAANRVMVKLGPTSTGGPDNALCVYNAVGSINVIVDSNGWYGSATATASPTGYQYQALSPTRICDTRFTSTSCSTGALGTGTPFQRLITVAGQAGVPAFISGTKVVAIIANLTGVAPTAATYLALYPANFSSPTGISDLNPGAGAVVPNLAVVEVDTLPSDAHDGDVWLYNGAGSVNAILDLEGWFQ
ncbi:MAG: GH25 family lysozyme [Candidatus Dormiibacterota bacterium]